MKKYIISLIGIIVILSLSYIVFINLSSKKDDRTDQFNNVGSELMPTYSCAGISTIRQAVNTRDMKACSCIDESLLEECLMNISDTKKYLSALERNDLEICKSIESIDTRTICEQQVYKNQSNIKNNLENADSYSNILAISNMHYRDAIPLLEAEILKPGFNKAYLNILANFYGEKALRERLEDEYIPKAISLLERSLILDPDNVNTYIVYGFIYEVAGDINKSIEMYNKALEMEPNNIQALLGRAHAKEFLSDNNSAAEDYLAAINLDKNNEHINANLGLCRLAYSHFALELAIDNCLVVTRNVTSSNMNLVAEAHQILAAIYLDMSDFNKSLISLKEAEALNPNDNNLLLQYAIYYLETDNLDKSEEYALRVANNDRTRAYPYLILGGVYALRNNYQTSIDHSYKALELVDNDISILPTTKISFTGKLYNNLVYSYERMGDVNTAMKYAELMN